jgi:hypothetical protein
MPFQVRYKVGDEILPAKMDVYAVRTTTNGYTDFLFWDDPSGTWVWADARDFVPVV